MTDIPAVSSESGTRRRVAAVAVPLFAALAASAASASGATSLPSVVGPPGGYPGGRGAELITPSDKNLGVASGVLPIAPGGSDDAIGFGISAGLPDSRGFQVENTLVGRRTATGWKLTDATIPSAGNRESSSGGANAQGVQVSGYSADLSTMLLTGDAPLTADDADGRGVLDAFRYAPTTQKIERLSAPDGTQTAPSGQASGTQIRGASEDLSAVVMQSDASTPLTANASPTTATLYRRIGGTLDIVSRLPDGTVAGADPNATFPAVTAIGNRSRGYGQPESFAAFVPNGGARGISADGSRVLFNYSTFSFDTFLYTSRLYLRDGNSRTLAVSRSRRAADADEVKSASVVGMSRDGGTVYFVSDDPLTDDGDGGGLYRYRVEGDRLDRLMPSQTQGGSSISSAIMSSDGSTVYFVSSADLAPGAVDGQSNAYAWTAAGLRHIVSWDGPGAISRVSRDGGYAVLSSSASVAGAPNGGHDALYVLRRADATVSCATCRPDGSDNDGDASLDAIGPASLYGEIAPRNITDDGRLFFTTTDRLVEGDGSDARDAYEFDGTRPRLLSSGTGGSSYVADNSDDGRTVFITTTDRLAAQDTDVGEADLYALRVGGGFAAPADPPAPCVADACRPETAGSGGALVPGSTAAVPLTQGKRDEASTVRTVRLSLRKATASSSRVSVSVAVPSAGVLRVSGSGLRTVSRRTKRAATYSVSAPLSSSARKRLLRSGRLKIAVRVRFAPTTGGSSTVSKSVTARVAGRTRAASSSSATRGATTR